jgi:hypothetical protein
LSVELWRDRERGECVIVLLRLKRQLSFRFSMVSQRWSRRSSSVVVILGCANDDNRARFIENTELDVLATPDSLKFSIAFLLGQPEDGFSELWFDAFDASGDCERANQRASRG